MWILGLIWILAAGVNLASAAEPGLPSSCVNAVPPSMLEDLRLSPQAQQWFERDIASSGVSLAEAKCRYGMTILEERLMQQLGMQPSQMPPVDELDLVFSVLTDADRSRGERLVREPFAPIAKFVRFERVPIDPELARDPLHMLVRRARERGIPILHAETAEITTPRPEALQPLLAELGVQIPVRAVPLMPRLSRESDGTPPPEQDLPDGILVEHAVIPTRKTALRYSFALPRGFECFSASYGSFQPDGIELEGWNGQAWVALGFPWREDVWLAKGESTGFHAAILHTITLAPGAPLHAPTSLQVPALAPGSYRLVFQMGVDRSRELPPPCTRSDEPVRTLKLAGRFEVREQVELPVAAPPAEGPEETGQTFAVESAAELRLQLAVRSTSEVDARAILERWDGTRWSDPRAVEIREDPSPNAGFRPPPYRIAHFWVWRDRPRRWSGTVRGVRPGSYRLITKVDGLRTIDRWIVMARPPG